MKENKFTRRDGTEGTEYKLEAGDEIVSEYSKVRTTDNETVKYPKHQLGCKWKGAEGKIYVTLTTAQKEKLDKEEDLAGKTIVAYKYENKYGEQVGVAIKE